MGNELDISAFMGAVQPFAPRTVHQPVSIFRAAQQLGWCIIIEGFSRDQDGAQKGGCCQKQTRWS